MEQLAKMVAIIILVLVAILCGSLWLLHSAINDGNVWKGIVGGGLALWSAGMLLGGIFASRG